MKSNRLHRIEGGTRWILKSIPFQFGTLIYRAENVDAEIEAA